MNNEYGYITQYHEAIKNKEIIVGQWITKWYEKVISDLDNNYYYYDKKKANKSIRFIERFCRHSQGEKGGEQFRLELWQKAMLSIIFGCVTKDGYRQFRECVCVVGRKTERLL